jgi:phospholipid transport system transporter-binding protein
LAQITQDGNRWLISGAMTVAEMNSLLAESTALAGSAHVEVDLKGVSDVDTSAISLLFEWLRQANTRNAKVVFSNLPENLVSLATLYGVLELIPQTTH